MKKIFVLTALFIVLVIVFTGAVFNKNNDEPYFIEEDNNNSDYYTYINNLYGFKINCPKDWAYQDGAEDTGIVVVFGSPKESEDDFFCQNINIRVEDAGGLTFDEYTGIITEIIGKSYSDVKIKKSGYSTLSDLQAYEIEYIYNVQGVDIQVEQIFTIKNGYIYCVAYTNIADTEDVYLEIAKNIIKSFRFI